MDLVLRQMAVTVKKGAVFPRAHVEMQDKVETFTPALKLQAQPANAPSMQLATEASKPSSALSQSCSETSKISTNSFKRAPLLFSPSKFFISDSLKFFWFIKHDTAGKKAKDVRCSEVPITKHDLDFASDIAIKQENLLDLDSSTNIKPLLTPVELSKLGKTKVEIRKTDYVNKAVKNITGWLHSVWSYKRPRKISKGHSNSVASDELYLCNGCEQQILSEILRSNNIQIAVRYATPEGQWQDEKMADYILPEEAGDCHESGCSVEDPIVYVKHDQESFAKFLHNVPLKEIKTISQLSDLCHLAYIIPKMKAGDLLSQHNLTFVTSSLDRKAQAYEKEKDANKVVSLSTNEAQNAIKESTLTDDLSLSSAIVCTTNSGAPSCSQSDDNSFLRLKNENADAGNENADAGSSLGTQILNAVSPVNVNLAKGAGLGPVSSNLCNDESIAALAQECYLMHHSSDASPQSKSEACLLHTCPCEWFCCDDKATRTRYFVIQGSESLASWQTNLTFDPVQFEDASLGALVHRGIYEAAKGLYRQLLPDILEHLQKHGSLGRIRFTGHSLGGSLAILLFLMLQIRGAVKSNVLLPVMTFGSPSIMCGGDNMLEKLNIPQSLIQSVVMHRDIVPRSFSCHYPDHVAEVLKRINGVFRQHPCLIHQKLLYAPMGDLYILQPEEGVATPHPFLPEGSGMYLMRHPIQNQGILSHSNSSIEAMELQAALRAFLNSPHPLEILRDPGSYGSNGSISRNHDPRSYAKALDVVLLQELERQMHTKCKRNRQFLWPLFTTLSSGQRVGRLDLIESQATRGAVSSAVGVKHHELRQPVSSATRGGQQHVSMITALGANLSRHIRYKRLIASQHVQMGMLFIVSAKVLLVEGFLALLAWI